MPSSATLVPSGPWIVRQLHQPCAFRTRGIDQVPAFDRESHRFRDATDSGDRTVDDQRAFSRRRGDEALTAGQVAECAFMGQLSGIGNRPASLETQPEVAAVVAGDAGLAAAVEDLGHPASASTQVPHVVGHHPGQHLFGRPGQRRRARPGLAGPLPGGGMGERLDSRCEQYVGRHHRLCDGRRRLAGVGIPLAHDREHRLGPDRLGLRAHRLTHSPGGRVADDQHLFVRPHPEALPHDRGDRLAQVFAHRRTVSVVCVNVADAGLDTDPAIEDHAADECPELEARRR